ncbi:MAG: hypothetical protein P1V97_06380 [Planctomycetota bacterium]|nr:hypothetical protein [Planctomycetota bacterium]
MGRLCSIALALSCLLFGPEIPSLAQDNQGRLLSFGREITDGQSWQLDYEEESEQRLTVEGRPRPPRKTRIAFKAKAEFTGGSTLVDLSGFSGNYLDVSWKDKSAKLVLTHSKDGYKPKWSEVDWADAQSKRSLTWLKSIFKKGLPQAMGLVFLPKEKVQAGSSWSISVEDWLKIGQRSKADLKGFKGQGKIVAMSADGKARFLIKISYQPTRFGKKSFEEKAHYELTLSGTVSLEDPQKPFQVTTESVLEGTVMVESLPGHKSKTKVYYKQKRILKRS